MKKIVLLVVLMGVLVASTPSHGFLDYLFSGSASKGAIGNSVAGDLRAWWTGNPIYNYNPYYAGPNTQAPANQGQGAYGPSGSQGNYQRPSMQYYPPQQAQGSYGQGYPQYTQQPAPGYAPQPEAYQQQPQAYPGSYQQQPQSYPGGYQGQPQAYQYQAPGPQAYQMAPQGGYYQGGQPAYQGGQPAYPGYPAQ